MTDGRSPTYRGYRVFDRMLQEANRNVRVERHRAMTSRLGGMAGLVGMMCAVATLAVHFGNLVAEYQRVSTTMGLATATFGFLASWAYSVTNGRRTRRTTEPSELIEDEPKAGLHRR